jgi:DNA-binding response OmpR family regulator
VSVRDTGIGIPPEKLASVFDMFWQVDSAFERSQSGLGIGLTIVKRLVDMHGGTVEARSAGLGKGSEFIVRLPVSPPTLPASRDVARAEPAPTVSRKVLVVDDNVDSAESLATLLRLSGHDALLAHDGVGAIEAAERHRPDVVLLDIGLPRMNGHEVCRRLRERPWSNGLVVIAVTGWGQGDESQKWQEAGFDAHLVKPAQYDELAALLSKLSRKREQHAERSAARSARLPLTKARPARSSRLLAAGSWAHVDGDTDLMRAAADDEAVDRAHVTVVAAPRERDVLDAGITLFVGSKSTQPASPANTDTHACDASEPTSFSLPSGGRVNK